MTNRTPPIYIRTSIGCELSWASLFPLKAVWITGFVQSCTSGELSPFGLGTSRDRRRALPSAFSLGRGFHFFSAYCTFLHQLLPAWITLPWLQTSLLPFHWHLDLFGPPRRVEQTPACMGRTLAAAGTSATVSLTLMTKSARSGLAQLLLTHCIAVFVLAAVFCFHLNENREPCGRCHFGHCLVLFIFLFHFSFLNRI